MDYKPYITIASFDIGFRNFSWVVFRVPVLTVHRLKKIEDNDKKLEILFRHITILDWKVCDLGKIKSSTYQNNFDNNDHTYFFDLLHSLYPFFVQTDIFLIEQQYFQHTTFRKVGGANMTAIKIAESLYTYLRLYYPKSYVSYFSPKFKTKKYDKSKMNKRERKGFSIKLIRLLLKKYPKGKYNAAFDAIPKKDDVADSMLQGLTFLLN
jgi:hypothetical protein